jgi:uncharacterized membrane protein YgcG
MPASGQSTASRLGHVIRALRATAAVAILVGLVVTAAPTALVRADVQDFEFESMHADFELGRAPDGTSTLRVVETLVAIFPDFDQNRGIVRSIPTSYHRVGIDFHLESVTDEHGDPVYVETSTWRDYDGTDFVDLALGTDEYVHGRTTYVITWTARDVVGTFSDTDVDEFYWDVNGTGWRQPFGTVSATVHVAPELRDAIRPGASCYHGYEDDAQRCGIEESGTVFSVEVSPIAASQNVSFAIPFERGTFVPGAPIDRLWVVTVLPWVLLGVLAATTALVVLLRTLLWRHARGRGIIVPEYEAPEGFGVMLAAEMLRRRSAALPAQIVNLVVKGIVRLVEDPDQPETRRFRLDLVDIAAATDRDDDVALRKLFGKKNAKDGASLVLDRRKPELGDRVASLVGGASTDLRTRGYLSRGERSPLRRLIFWPAFACLLAAVGIVVWCAVNDVGNGWLTFGIIVIALWSLVTMGYSGRPERRTAEGTAVYERLLGLRDYIRLAEADRLRVLQSPQGADRRRIDPGDREAVVRLYEELLPWAMVWGLEREWAEVLGRVYEQTTAPASTLSFATTGISTIASLGSSLSSSGFQQTVTTSSSSGSGGSSFSGGSSGGGFSGGGGGGGGGGGR